MKKWQLFLVMLLLSVLLIACGNSDDDNNSKRDVQPGDIEQIEPDLDNVPDIVATVNGDEITRDEFEYTFLSQFQQVSFEAQMRGEEFDQDKFKADLVDSMIAQKLLVQEADRREFEADEEEIDEIIAEFVTMYKLESSEELFALFEDQGLSEEDLKVQLRTQVKLDKLIEDETRGFSISKEEIEALYEELVAVYEEMNDDQELPPLEEIEEDVEGQLLLQGENEIMFELIEELREEAEIVNNM